MIIRCPQCEHARSIPESRVPPRAEVATCPKCGQRFRFRTLPTGLEEEAGGNKDTGAQERGKNPLPENAIPEGMRVQHPQSAVADAASQN
ncbi:zinc-ribbon domain-containing protein, partial [Desulfovibrio sp. OttesenSCG-928-A18]|nr:zinc-ribbon domain-containing protein [Desulfovibrio sp. OttesenSCG-928-A18]